MNKTIFIKLVFIFGIFIVLALLIYTLRMKPQESNIQPTSVIDRGQTVQTSNGIRFSDPKESTNFANLGAGVYISDERQLGDDVGFNIAYFEEDGSFAIGLTGKPLEEYHKKASRYLLETLHITEEEACELNVYVGVTYDVDPNLSGKNFMLSFCPGSVQL